MYTEYLGVYENNYFKTKEEYPYRVAIKRYVNSKPEYTNVGIFKTKETAAYIYNIYALSLFGKGAVINKVDLTDEIEEEALAYYKDTDELEILVAEATKVAEEYGAEIKVHKP